MVGRKKMDKFDYITATIEEEKQRLEKIIDYLEDNNITNDELLDYKERYNNICKYLTLKGKYLEIKKRIDNFKGKLGDLNESKDEYEVDNILLEDTLLSSFNSDTIGKYRNVLYEDIKNYDSDIRDILYLVFEKESDYNNLVIKRDKLLNLIDEKSYPKMYNTLISQSALIEKEKNVLDDIFIIENNIKIEEDKLSELEDGAMVVPILKILYEFWITNSYDPRKVDKTKVFMDNKNLINIKNSEVLDTSSIDDDKVLDKDIDILPNINLPGINEDHYVDIDGKDYVKNDF